MILHFCLIVTQVDGKYEVCLFLQRKNVEAFQSVLFFAKLTTTFSLQRPNIFAPAANTHGTSGCDFPEE